MSGNCDETLLDLRIVPANQASVADLDAIYGAGTKCRCQWFKLERKESFGDIGEAGLRQRQLQQTGCGNPESTTTSGLIGYLDDEPVAWVAGDTYRNLCVLSSRVFGPDLVSVGRQLTGQWSRAGAAGTSPHHVLERIDTPPPRICRPYLVAVVWRSLKTAASWRRSSCCRDRRH
jgi:hypothetical protein